MENVILIQADKGKTTVIINSKEYSKNVQTFLMDNNFRTLQKDSTVKHQKLIQKTLQQSNLIIDKKKIKYLTQKKPLLPTLKAQLKIHKPNIPISNMNDQNYKTAKHLVGLLNRHLTL
jgi:formylmethanofuran dehydrogenase subunit E